MKAATKQVDPVLNGKQRYWEFGIEPSDFRFAAIGSTNDGREAKEDGSEHWVHSKDVEQCPEVQCQDGSAEWY